MTTYNCPFCNSEYEMYMWWLKRHFKNAHKDIALDNLKAVSVLMGRKKEVTKDELLIAALSYMPRHARNKKHLDMSREIIRENCEVEK